MNRWQTILAIEEQYKVRDLDDAIRTVKRSYDLPFFQKKSSLKVFSGVYQYPPAPDHDYLIYIDRSQQDVGYASKLRARYTSLQQFFEDPDYRNQIAEIWESNTLTIGVRDKNNQYQGLASQELDTCESVTGYTASGDASNVQISYLNFKEGNSSIQFSVVLNTGVARIKKVLDSSFIDANYKEKWHFRWVFLGGMPTDVKLRLGADSSNYLESSALTSQFAGQPLILNQWNQMAFDLSTATVVGTIDQNTTFTYAEVILNGAPSGTYYIDASYDRSWELLDYWYYSKYAVQSLGSTEADQESFYDVNDVYSLDSSLVGVAEWADVVMYEAMLSSLTDKENANVYNGVKAKRDMAWDALMKKWPDMKPQMTYNRYRWSTEYTNPNYIGYWGEI